MNPNIQRALMGVRKTTSFSPLDIADCHLGLDATDTSSLFSDVGGTTIATSMVRRINDQSSYGNNPTINTSGAEPVTASRSLNGLNILDFDGSNDRMLIPFAALNYGATTIAGVYIPDTTSTNMMVAATNGSTGSDTSVVFGSQRTSFGDGMILRGSPISGGGVIHISSVSGAGSGSTQRVKFSNDAEQSGTADRLGIGTQFLLGAYGNGGSNFFDGGFAELWIWHRQITNTEKNQLGNYWSNKYNIPYSNI